MIRVFVERHEFPQYESAGIRIHEKNVLHRNMQKRELNVIFRATTYGHPGR
jgi:hypothetical protein